MAPVSPSAFNLSDPETDNSMQETDASAVLSNKDFSDPSTSEESSLTGSDRYVRRALPIVTSFFPASSNLHNLNTFTGLWLWTRMVRVENKEVA